jgi:hypothetical protein
MQRLDAGEQRRARTGAISRSIASSASLLWAPARLKNTEATRSSLAPLRSKASIVLAKDAGSRLAAMSAISERFWGSAISKAGAKCSGASKSKGGASNGPVQASSSGLAGVATGLFTYGSSPEFLAWEFAVVTITLAPKRR